MEYRRSIMAEWNALQVATRKRGINGKPPSPLRIGEAEEGSRHLGARQRYLDMIELRSSDF